MKNKILFFGLVTVFLVLTIWFASIEPEGVLKELVLRYGYLSFLGVAFLGGLNFAFPSLHLAFIVPLLSAGLDFWILVMLGAVGSTLADGIGYVLGRSGEESFGVLRRVGDWGKKFVAKHPRLTPVIIVGWASFVPMPNEIFVIPAGVIRYGFWRTISFTFLGNIVFNLITLNFGNLFV